MSDPLALRIKAIGEGDVNRPDLLEADFDHERAAIIGGAIDLALEAVPVYFIDETEAADPIEDVCGYGESPSKLRKVAAVKTALKHAWNLNMGDALINNDTDRSLLEAADALCVPATGAPPAVLGRYPYLRSRLQQGLNTAVEEGVNFAWTVPGVVELSSGGPADESADESTVVRRSLGTLRELAAIDRRHLGPVLVALKGSIYVAGLHGEHLSKKGRNLGYRRDMFVVDESGRAVFKHDLLDLEVTNAEGKTWKVGSFGPDHLLPIGCPALKVRAFTAAARCVTDVFDRHELWPSLRLD